MGISENLENRAQPYVKSRAAVVYASQLGDPKGPVDRQQATAFDFPQVFES